MARSLDTNTEVDAMTVPAASGEQIPCRVKLGDGRLFEGPLSPADHRALHLQLLHATTSGYIELTPGTANEHGKASIDRRRYHRHYLTGPDRSKDWLKAKCGFGQEFVIIGWRPSDVAHAPKSALDAQAAAAASADADAAGGAVAAV